MELRRGYCDTTLGQLHYVEQGSGTPLLLLHQTPRSADEFVELQPLLAGQHRAIAMDMLGFGLSAAEEGGQSIAGMASGAIALLDGLGIDTCHIMGHHTGGAVAIEIASRVPSRVAGLVLSSAPLTDLEYRTSHSGGPGVDEADVAEDGTHLTQLWALRQPYYPTGRPDLLNRFIRDALSPGVDPAAGHMACAQYVMEDTIGQVKAPTLLIGAELDPFALPAVAKLQQRLTAVERLEVHVIEGGMIPLMEQKAPELAQVVLPFLAGADTELQLPDKQVPHKETAP